MLISAALISLVENQLAPAWAVVIIIGREFAVTGLRSIAAADGVVISASRMGKFKMLAQVITVALLIVSRGAKPRRCLILVSLFRRLSFGRCPSCEPRFNICLGLATQVPMTGRCCYMLLEEQCCGW